MSSSEENASSQTCSHRGFISRTKNQTCTCFVYYKGTDCKEVNAPYFDAWTGIYLTVFIIAMLQIAINIISELTKQKSKSWKTLAHVSTQKILYLLSGIACLIRAYDFQLKKAEQQMFSKSDLSGIEWDKPNTLFHVLMITCLSLVICYWSECYFVSDFTVKLEQKQFFGVFLKKSSIPFILFNSIIYLGTLLQFTVHLFSSFIDFEADTTTLITIVFNSILSFVLFSTQVSLLTIGVEIYFKIQGAFRYEDQINKPLFQQLLTKNREDSEIYPLNEKNLDNFTNSTFKSTPLKIKSRRVHSHTDINFRYALAARLGVCLQGFFSLLLSLFIVSDIISRVTKNTI